MTNGWHVWQTIDLAVFWAEPPTAQERRDIVSIDPMGSGYQIHDLIEETFRLVETHLGEVDTQAARERFRGQRRAREHT